MTRATATTCKAYGFAQITLGGIMKIAALRALPIALQEYFFLTKTIKAKERGKDGAKNPALASLVSYLGDEKSVLIVTQTGLAVCDVNPQAHPVFDRAEDSPEIRAIIDAEKDLKSAQAAMMAALAAGKRSGRVVLSRSDSIRLEILGKDKIADVQARYRSEIRRIRKGATAELSAR